MDNDVGLNAAMAEAMANGVLVTDNFDINLANRNNGHPTREMASLSAEGAVTAGFLITAALTGGQSAVVAELLGFSPRSLFKKSVKRSAKSIQDQMTLRSAKNGNGDVIIDNLSDPKFKGMQKMELKVKSNNGNDSVVHFVRDPKTGNLKDFKFKKRSNDKIRPLGNDPAAPPGG